MKVDDFLTDIGDILQEDYTTSPVWTKAEVFGYIKQALKMFCQMTQLFDKSENILVNGTTGEAPVPEDYEHSYFIQFNQLMQDAVSLNDLDFVQDGWLSGTSGTPKAASILGSGSGSAIRFAPVPSSVYDGGPTATPTAGLVISDGGSNWTVTCNHGILVTTAGGVTPTTPVIEGPSTYWDLTISNVGILATTASTSTTPDDISLVDSLGGSNDWLVRCTDTGVIYTETVYTNYGIGVAAMLDYGDYQDFNSGGGVVSANYGIIVDAYADSLTTTPSSMIKVNGPVGLSLFCRTNTEAATVWYKGSHRDLGSYYHEIWLYGGLFPILKHGVLALAYAQDGDGRDDQKAELFKNIFFAECTSIRGIFESRWE